MPRPDKKAPKVRRGYLGPGGRPTMLTDEFIRDYVVLIRNGIPKRHAAAAKKVSWRQVENWLDIGRREDGPPKFQEFAMAVAEAEAIDVTRRMQTINDATNRGDAKAAQWYLERRYPKDFGAAATEHKVEFKLPPALRKDDPRVVDAEARMLAEEQEDDEEEDDAEEEEEPNIPIDNPGASLRGWRDGD